MFGLPQYELNTNLGSLIANQIVIDSFKTISNVNVKHSIQELKNKVVYVDNSEESWKEVAKDNPSSINTYGMLKYVEKVDTSKYNNLQKLADDKLKELNKLTTSMSLSLLCNYRVAKGKVLNLNVPEYGLNGLYLITSCNHTITSCKDIAAICIKKYQKN